jgi:hypothetical protein
VVLMCRELSFHLEMAPKHKSSDASNLDMPKINHWKSRYITFKIKETIVYLAPVVLNSTATILFCVCVPCPLLSIWLLKYSEHYQITVIIKLPRNRIVWF